MASKQIFIHTREFVVGSALRNLIWQSEGRSYKLSYEGKVEIGDIVLAKVINENDDKLDTSVAPSNYVERIYLDKGRIVIRNERIKAGAPVIITAGNRYSSKTFTGGIRNPITGGQNKTICVGDIIQNLGHLNVCGLANYNYGEEEPATLQVVGIIMNDSGEKMNIRDYPKVEGNKDTGFPPKKTIIVTGDDTESGKTACCTMIASICKLKHVHFIYQKISGGPRIRDIITVLYPEQSFQKIGDCIHFPMDMNALDFVDIGYISSHSVSNFKEYCQKSITALNWLCLRYNPDIAIIEVAGNYSQAPNQLIMQHCGLMDTKHKFIIAASQGIEAATGIVNDLSKNQIKLDRIAISGILTSSTNFDMFRTIVRHEIGCQWLTTNPQIKEEEYEQKQWESFITD